MPPAEGLGPFGKLRAGRWTTNAACTQAASRPSFECLRTNGAALGVRHTPAAIDGLGAGSLRFPPVPGTIP
ncbi:MAG: hypothetical protein J4N29_03990, partial [Chloroflexi bacterium]|nr:hypothetical protein [Chloroflexota bacterium]